MKKSSDELLITHLFDAPPALVFDAWTDPEQLQHWFAPDGCTIEFKSITVETGGSFHSCVHDPMHGDCWIKGIYQEVTYPAKLVFSMTLTNGQGDTVQADDAGKPDDWPQTIITTVTFTAIGDQTEVVLHQTVAEAKAKETGAYQSWFSMFERLKVMLAASQS